MSRLITNLTLIGLVATMGLVGPGCAQQKGAGKQKVQTVTVGGVKLRQGGKARAVKVRPVKEYNEAVEVYETGKTGGLVDHRRVELKLQAVLKKEPAFADAWFNMGVNYQEQGDDPKARQAYSKALELDPNYMDALANLGKMQMEQGDRAGAIASFEKAIEIDTVNPAARNNLAVVYRQNAVKIRENGDIAKANKMFAKAVGHVRKVLAGDPQNVQAYNNLALIYYDLRKYELAQLVCLNALKFDKPDAGLHSNLGLILLKLNKVTQALKSFNQSLEVSPQHVPAHMNIGLITLSYRDYATAEGHFTSALKVQPKNVRAMVGRGVAMRGLGKYEEALALFDKAAGIDGKNPRPHWNKGILFQQYLQKPKAAIKAYGRYLQLAPTSDKKDRQQAETRIKNLEIVLKYAAEEEAESSANPKGAPEDDEGGADEGGADEGAAPPADKKEEPADEAAPEATEAPSAPEAKASGGATE